MSPRQRYFNPNQTPYERSALDFLRWLKFPKNQSMSPSLKHTENKQYRFLQTNRTITSITWIGHSTFLLQIGGVNILTDPVWATFIGLIKRLNTPGIPLDHLPSIDVVLISHGHYDHLHFTTLRKLKGDPLFLVPEGLQDTFINKGFSKVKELSWWQHFEKTPIHFTFVPALHASGRNLFDQDTSHWGGWICRSLKTGETLYFAGDTGYFPGFMEMGKNFDIDVALLPIGAHEAGMHSKSIHLSPEDAVLAFQDLKAKTCIPMHYGTFHMGNDSGLKAVSRLRSEWNRRQIKDGNLRILELGETWKNQERSSFESE